MILQVHRAKDGDYMKKAIRLIATILVVCVVVIALNLLIEGVPLLGTPKLENIDRVVVEHSDYPDDVKEYTDENNIKLAEALLGYLHYAPLKGLTDDNPVIQITYIMDDGTEYIVKANDNTVWWNGKPHAIHDESMFTKMCTAVFYLQN